MRSPTTARVARGRWTTTADRSEAYAERLAAHWTRTIVDPYLAEPVTQTADDGVNVVGPASPPAEHGRSPDPSEAHSLGGTSGRPGRRPDNVVANSSFAIGQQERVDRCVVDLYLDHVADPVNYQPLIAAASLTGGSVFYRAATHRLGCWPRRPR